MITVILAIPGLIKNSKFLDYWDFFTNNASQYHDCNNQGLGIFFLWGNFSGPSHPNNQGLAVLSKMILCMWDFLAPNNVIYLA